MIKTTFSNFKKNLFVLLEQTVKFNEVVHISTKKGNVMMISEEVYNGLMESLFFASNPVMRKRALEGLDIPIEDCVSEDDFDW